MPSDFGYTYPPDRVKYVPSKPPDPYHVQRAGKGIDFTLLVYGIIAAVILTVWSVWIYSCENCHNPNSRFCAYKIYKQTDGTYQVWLTKSFDDCVIDSGLTYEQAKAKQIEHCSNIDQMENRKPTGELMR